MGKRIVKQMKFMKVFCGNKEHEESVISSDCKNLSKFSQYCYGKFSNSGEQRHSQTVMSSFSVLMKRNETETQTTT